MTRLEKAAHIGSIATCCLAALGILVAIWQIRASERSQREASAREAYKEYLKLALEKPEFAEAQKQNGPYRWFVEYFLYSAEQIYLSFPGDSEWGAALSTQICLHRTYLQSPEYRSVLPSQYAPTFSAFVEKALEGCGKN